MDVVRWVPVSNRWVGHRAEPLIGERLWGCDAPLPDDVLARSEFWAEAGFDADGRPAAFRERSRHDDGEADEVVTIERLADGTTVVHLAEGGEARTFFDDAGLATRTVYVDEDGEEDEETYHYDDAGRLVAINESAALGGTHDGGREYTGGRLSVEHDDGGAARIVDASGDVVWERPTRPWAEELERAADVLATGYLGLLAAAVQDEGLVPGTESYGLSLVYVDQNDINAVLAVGLEDDRRAAGGGEDGAVETLYIEGDLPWITDQVLGEKESVALLRVASMGQPDDPWRVVLGEVVRRLSESDLPGLTKTQDFVGWVAEHDEGLAEKVSSIRIHNRADAVARWEAGWGGQVLPYTHD